MPWAIFSEPFDFDFRPQKPVGQHVKASEKPQEFPARLINAAVAAGVAERVKSPTAAQKRTLKSTKQPLETTEKAHG